MAAIKVLVVGDGPFMEQSPPALGINFAPSQDLTDNTFTVSEFVYLLRNNTVPSISVDTAHRRADPNATFQNFTFTQLNLLDYDVIWLFGYEGWNYRDYGSAISVAEIQAIANFMAAGGGVFATGDHAGMGSLMCGQIPRVRTMRNWFGRASDQPTGYPTTAVDYGGNTISSVNRPGESGNPTPAVGRADTLQQNPTDTSTQFQFDDQSDNIPQQLGFPNGIVHPILQGENGPLAQYPDHMHEGEVVTPSDLTPVLTINGQQFTEYPTLNGFQPAPMIIATGKIVPNHATVVEGATCEQNNFTTDDTPTVADTIGTLCAYDGRGAGVGRVVTDSSFHHFLDLNLVGDPCGTTADRLAGFGPALTPPASGSTLVSLQAFYVNTVIWLAKPQPNFYFAVDKSTFGFDEASDGNTFPSFDNAFWLVVEGYTLAQVQSSVNSLQLAGPFAATGVMLTRGAPIATQAQRVLIPYSVQFSGGSMGAFPGTGSTVELLLEASITVAGAAYAAETTFELVAGADPHFVNINPQQNNVFYLSQDLCVFTVTPGLNTTPIPGVPVSFTTGNPTGEDPVAASQFITNLLSYLNGQSAFTDAAATANPFANFPSAFAASGDSSVTPKTDGFTNYNFAVARVRLNGPVGSSAQPVKTFFRLFLTQTNDTDFQPATSYLSTLDPSGFPDQPQPAPDGESIPFFASGSAGGDYDSGGTNVQTITVGAGGVGSGYFGCFLNVYSGAFNWQMMGTHHCIVAQIAYDGAPIINANGITLSPDNSDKLAQRNLQITPSGNPGSAASRRIPQTFDLRPSPAISPVAGALLDYPDELMIDWGNTPAGSVASIYWPQVDAIDVVRLASQFYGTNELSLLDAHTVQCKVGGGYSYVPIPSGGSERFAGLFTVDLPPGVIKGQEFNIVVRRLSSRQTGNAIAVARTVSRPAARRRTRAAAARTAVARLSPGSVQRNWRYVVGTFQVKIPVAAERTLLLPEENTYAIMLWRLGMLSASSRWYPVLQRYLSYIGARVTAFGGNPITIKPSPTGVPIHGGPGGHPGHPGPGSETDELTGKVAGLIYDRFGDFEGFLLITEHGQEHRFHATEAEIETLARYAWADRIVVSVIVGKHHPRIPISIILRRKPHLEH